MGKRHAGGEEWQGMQRGARYDPDADAGVIAAARANIEKIRKRDVELRVTDAAGRPLADMPVEIVQKRHGFCFGDQLWHLDRLYRFGQGDTDGARYFKLRFSDVLNAANALCYWTERPRNDGPKMEDIQGHPSLEGFHRCVDWAAGEGLTVKGHPLFWSIPKCVPDWVKRYDYETRMKFAEVRVRPIAPTTWPLAAVASTARRLVFTAIDETVAGDPTIPTSHCAGATPDQ